MLAQSINLFTFSRIYCEKPRTEFDESLKMGIPEKQMHNETDEVEEIDLPSREEDFEEFIIKLEKTGWKNWNSQRSHKCKIHRVSKNFFLKN